MYIKRNIFIQKISRNINNLLKRSGSREKRTDKIPTLQICGALFRITVLTAISNLKHIKDLKNCIVIIMRSC